MRAWRSCGLQQQGGPAPQCRLPCVEWHFFLLLIRGLLYVGCPCALPGIIALGLLVTMVEEIVELQRYLLGLEILIDALDAEVDEMRGG